MLLAKPAVVVVQKARCTCFLCADFDFAEPKPAPSKYHRAGVRILNGAETAADSRAAEDALAVEAAAEAAEAAAAGGGEADEGPLSGKKARIHGLTQLTRKGEDVNGMLGLCTRYWRGSGRYTLRILRKRSGLFRGTQKKKKGAGLEFRIKAEHLRET